MHDLHSGPNSFFRRRNNIVQGEKAKPPVLDQEPAALLYGARKRRTSGQGAKDGFLRDEASRIAANIAELPELLRKL